MSRIRYRSWCRKSVRREQINNYLSGREAKSLKEIAKGVGVSHATAHYLVKGMLEEELIYIQDIRGRPVKYYIPMRKQA